MGAVLAASASRIGVAAEGEAMGRRLWLARLVVTDFRNYSQASVALGLESVVLNGANGAGKTNILEAVSMLTPGRGLRGAAYADLARLNGTGGWSVAARLSHDGTEVALGTGQPAPSDGSAASGRVVRIDGETSNGSGALADYVQVLWLTPSMDGLFTGPASDRRRFLDRIVASFDDAHRTRLNAFERAMRQRNRLFEMGERSDRYFAAIESQMAETGTAIAAGRVEVVDRLAGSIAAGRSAGESPFPWADLALEGWLEAAVRGQAAVEVEDAYATRLAENRERDRAAGRTLEGPHRSDLQVGHGPKQMPGHLCSTGEQKALLIGLILAQAASLKSARGGIPPLLLLDEIAAHLDISRREALFTEIERLQAQAWMTGTDDEVFRPLRSTAQFFTVANGSITRNNPDQPRAFARP
jgi:DNA replication and repair protein RecF